MSGIDGIVVEIEAKAREKASETIAAARGECEKTLAETKARLDNAELERRSSLAAMSEEVIKRRVTLARPQARMAVLAAKQAELEAVFAQVRSELRRDAKAYAEFWLALVKDHCEDGDEVCADETDADILDKKWTEKLAAVSGKKLVRGKNVRTGGGLVIVGKTSEKDFSLTTVLKEYRSSLERETAEMLFGE